VSVTAIGDVHESGCLTRANAKAGDVVVVTGDFGASAAGLSLLNKTINEQKKYPYVFQRHVRPIPRLCESWALVRQTGNRASLMDASDGLADALVQIARASQVGIEVNQLDIPIHDQTKVVADICQVDPLEWALYGGEDYELVGTLPEEVWLKWKDNNPFTAIGKVTASPGVVLNTGPKKIALDLKKSFQHWQDL
jgi:thiamine-monophosphate kinase